MANNEVGFSRDINLLRENICFVDFRFPDGTVKRLRTTLNRAMLEGIEPVENCLFDLDRQKWFSLARVEDSQIEIYSENPPELKGADLFANKFIV